MDKREREVLRCEVAGVAADAAALDTLARLALLARRNGCELRIRGASRELRALIALAGLSDVLRE
jgi:ABC-type transporter Mla MlaB component